MLGALSGPAPCNFRSPAFARSPLAASRLDKIYINGHSGEIKIGDLGLAVLAPRRFAPGATHRLGPASRQGPHLRRYRKASNSSGGCGKWMAGTFDYCSQLVAAGRQLPACPPLSAPSSLPRATLPAAAGVMPEGDPSDQYTRSVDIFAYGLLMLELIT